MQDDEIDEDIAKSYNEIVDQIDVISDAFTSIAWPTLQKLKQDGQDLIISNGRILPRSRYRQQQDHLA